MTKVLIGVGDKEFGQAISKFVCNHDFGNDVEFKVVHVLEHPVFDCVMIGMADSSMANVIEEFNRRAKALVMAIGTELRTAFPQSSIEEITVDGSPHRELLRIAQEWPADFIILGSHGKGGLDRLMLGSVSLSVLSHADCSVMIVKLPQEVKPKPQKKAKEKMTVLY